VPVLALPEEVQVEVGELRTVGVGVVGDVLPVVRVAPGEAVVIGDALRLAAPLEDVRVRYPLHGEQAFRDGHLRGVGDVGPHQRFTVLHPAPEDTEGVVVPGLQEARQIVVQVRSRRLGGRCRDRGRRSCGNCRGFGWVAVGHGVSFREWPRAAAIPTLVVREVSHGTPGDEVGPRARRHPGKSPAS